MSAYDQLIGVPQTLALASNANQQQQLRNNFSIEFLHFHITGLLTLAGYSAAPTKRVESLENFLQSVVVQATGNTTDTLCNVDGPFLRTKSRMLEGTDVTRSDAGTSNGTYALETNLKKYFIDPRSNRGKLTTLNSAALSSLTVAFQTRDVTAMVENGTGGTAVLSGMQVVTFARQYLGKAGPNPAPYVKETQRNFAVGASQNHFRADYVPLGNVLRRQWFKGMVGDTSYADPSDALFGATGKSEGPHISLEINSNKSIPLDQVYQILRADNKTLLGLESVPTGYALWEPARDRKLSNSVPLAGVQTAVNFVDVNYTNGSTNTLQITDEEIVKLSAAQFNS